MMLGAGKYIPEAITGGIGLMSSMSTPLCMMILGVRLATVSLKRLFVRPFVYLACLGKLVVFPLFCFAAVYFLPLNTAFKMSVVILSGTPCASVIFNLSEMHKAEPELGANCVLLSTLLCFTTLPLLTLLF
jgi:predicted permease